MRLRLADHLVRLPVGVVGGAHHGAAGDVFEAQRMAEFAQAVEAAVIAPRIHLEGQHLSVEGGFDPEHLQELLAAYPSHHLWNDLNLFFGGVHTVLRDGAGLRGAGDLRRGGACIVVA
jgi:gamma-glutamyltranspeptidase/glutathione hydrolase